MNTISIIESKKQYMPPAITLIKLDNEISLALESNVDPNGEPGNWSKAPDYFKNDPFKSGLA